MQNVKWQRARGLDALVKHMAFVFQMAEYSDGICVSATFSCDLGTDGNGIYSNTVVRYD